MTTLPPKRDRAYKPKTIEKLIREQIDSWLESIEDEELTELIRLNYIVTGGAITSFLLGEPPNDYDVYFRTVECAERVARYYVEQVPDDNKPNIQVDDSRVMITVRSSGVAGGDIKPEAYQYFETLDNPQEAMDQFFKSSSHNNGTYSVRSITTNAISLTDNVQIVLRFVGEPDVIHKNYDFVHTTNYMTHEGLVLNHEALISTMTRELKYVGSLYPICSLFRLRKFIKRGWTISAGELFKIAYDASKLDLDDVSVLSDQLTGVDVAYFVELTSILRSKEGNIDRSYLFNLIDTIFNDATDETHNVANTGESQ